MVTHYGCKWKGVKHINIHSWKSILVDALTKSTVIASGCRCVKNVGVARIIANQQNSYIRIGGILQGFPRYIGWFPSIFGGFPYFFGAFPRFFGRFPEFFGLIVY